MYVFFSLQILNFNLGQEGFFWCCVQDAARKYDDAESMDAMQTAMQVGNSCSLLQQKICVFF